MSSEVHMAAASVAGPSSSSPVVFVSRIPMPSAHAASIAAQVLRVDPPLSNCTKVVEEENHVLVIKLQSTSARSLRTAVHATLEQLTLTTRTLASFATT